MNIDDAKDLCIRSIHIMGEGGTREDFDEVVHPEFLNHEGKDEPPATRGRGPEAAYATALWLRDAFADLRWTIHEVVAEGDLVAVHCTMSGQHVRAVRGVRRGRRVAQVFPPTGKTFASTQTHWLRVADGKVIEHWANRDDLGTACSSAGCRRRRCTWRARRWPSAALASPRRLSALSGGLRCQRPPAVGVEELDLGGVQDELDLAAVPRRLRGRPGARRRARRRRPGRRPCRRRRRARRAARSASPPRP